MKKLFVASLLIMLGVTSLRSQPDLRIITHPKLPPRDVLEKLNLSLAWHAKLTTAGNRDGLFTLQLIPSKRGPQLVVQTLYGAVYLIDAETGDILWRTPVGIPSWNAQPVGYNEQNIFVTRREILYILNRDNGTQRYYTLDKDTKLPTNGFSLPAPSSAAPRADNDMIFICMGHKLEAYLLPVFGSTEESIKKFTAIAGRELSAIEHREVLEKSAALPPLLQWNFQEADMNLEQPPVIGDANMAVVTSAGKVLTFNKFDRSKPYEFQTNGNVSAAMGKYGNMAYIGSEDYALYALNMENQSLAWRFLASAPILKRPEVTNRDIFLSSHRKGLYRLQRETGRAVWLNNQADRFLSTNQKYVYALDPTGVLLVLDYARGSLLGRHDMRDWIIPVPNDFNDRLYLANHDGQILCLRNRAEIVPLVNRSIEMKLPKKEEPKNMEKAKDDEKEMKGEKGEGK